jgi:hypothetical protein
MPQHVCNGATLACAFGTTPSTMVVLPVKRVLTSSQPAATIMDNVALLNILPFGMCMTPSNPAVAAATTAAAGVLTPMPCIPVTIAPWAPGDPTVLEGGEPVLNNTSTLTCLWAGVIQIAMPGQLTEEVP